MSIAESQFRQAMSHFASGVTVVTTAVDDQLGGLTVSSFTSLSLKPTLVLICIDLNAGSHAMLVTAGQFAVNILADDQAAISQRFATSDPDKFIPDTYTLSPRGLPLLNGTLAALECRIVNQLPGGDHSIFVGEVDHATVNPGRPLLYYRSGYHQLAPASD